ncbi:acyl-CoA N-acyltransferase [Peziza echinospora]|nr:acyl-CoA N-acyltransferase [Peziza echinospora]
MSAESKQITEPEDTPETEPATNVATVEETGTDGGAPSETKDKGKGVETAPKEKIQGAKENLRALVESAGWKKETEGMSEEKAREYMTSKMQELLTAASGRNAKDMGEYKFWGTQPVPKFGEDDTELPDGYIQPGDLAKVRTEPYPMLDNFEWVTMDLNDPVQMTEVYELLCGHYVEDDHATFRFNYSAAFLSWALKSPGWYPQWHVGVRAKTSKKLCAFISGIPVNIRVRGETLRCPEINFLCVHKKLRSKRLAPVLIKEITRRCNLEQIYAAVFTAGVILPRPVASCRYYHRSLNWLKLYEVGFSPLPPGSTKQRQISKYFLPSHTATPGLRLMESKDVKEVQSLLQRYLQKFEVAPELDAEEIDYWLLHKGDGERVIWTYVVEDPKTHKVTDFFSFYALESSVIQSSKHSVVRAAYLFYYASETAFETGPDAQKNLKVRLNALMHDALIIAKKLNFDVFNALTLLDNALFLADQKFGAGDGLLHYYLFNWRTKHINGGLDEHGKLNEAKPGSEVGLVML